MKIQLKRSNVLVGSAAKEPSPGQMEYGELAVNYNETDPAIFIKDSNNNIIRIAGADNIADDGTTNVPSGTTPPANPESGNLWFNDEEGRLYIYYVDADSSQWVDASPDSWDPSSYPDVGDDEQQSGTIDDRYLMLNAKNSPVTGDLTLSEKLTVDKDAKVTGSVGIGITAESKLTISPGNTGTTTFAGRKLAWGTNHISSSGRSGFSVRINNDFLPEDTDETGGGNAGFAFLYPFDENGAGSYRAIRISAGTTLTDTAFIRKDGGAYFANAVGVGTTTPQSSIQITSNSQYDGFSLRKSDGNIVASLVGLTEQKAEEAGSGNDNGCITLYTEGAKCLQFQASGDSYMVGGNLGIGTSSPSSTLDIQQKTNPTIGLTATNAAANNKKIINVMTGTDLYWQAIKDDGSGGGSLVKMTRSGNNINTFELTNSGTAWFYAKNDTKRLGINTTTPRSTLDLLGAASINMPATFWSEGGSYYDVSSYGSLTTQGSYAIHLTSGGYRGDNAKWVQLNPNGETGAAQIELNPKGYIDFNTELEKLTGVTAAVTRRMRLDDQGRLGIGTGGPLKLLHLAESYPVTESSDPTNTEHLKCQSYITNELESGHNDQVNAYGYGAGASGDAHNKMVAAATFYRQKGGGNYGLNGYFGIAVSDLSTGAEDPYGITTGELEEQTRFMINNAGEFGIRTTTPEVTVDVRDGDIFIGNSGVLPWQSTAQNKNGGTFVGRNARLNLYKRTDDGSEYLNLVAVDKDTGARSSRLIIGATGGIEFNANGSTLDDYEEGTFTPTFAYVGGSAAGSFTMDTNETMGAYTKVGDAVHVYMAIAWSAKNMLVEGTNLQIGNLPFPTENKPRGARQVLAVGYQSWLSEAGTITQVRNASNTNSFIVGVVRQTGDNNTTTPPASIIKNAGVFIVSGTYKARE